MIFGSDLMSKEKKEQVDIYLGLHILAWDLWDPFEPNALYS